VTNLQAGSDIFFGFNTICVLEEEIELFHRKSLRGERVPIGVMLEIELGRSDCRIIALVSRLFAPQSMRN
jgi:hypothetical protein